MTRDNAKSLHLGATYANDRHSSDEAVSAKIDFTFSIESTLLDENYHPDKNTRLTTNFANLARGKNRRENLRNALLMLNNRFNNLSTEGNPLADRYELGLEIISIKLNIDEKQDENILPLIEILKTNIYDRKSGQKIEGIAGNNFSSYVRDYDFSVLLVEHNKNKKEFNVPENFGDLHGKLYQYFVNSVEYKKYFRKPPVIALSVSSNKCYRRSENRHPVLGVEYMQDEYSLTDEYFKKMGLKVRYFMPKNSVAPLAFYFSGDLLADYSDLELISSISTMETFQKIYRPEIYNANSAAGEIFKPSLKHQDYSLTQVVYDREERSQLAIEQGKYAKENFILKYKDVLTKWQSQYIV